MCCGFALALLMMSWIKSIAMLDLILSILVYLQSYALSAVVY